MSEYGQQPSGWAIGGITFAGVMMVMVGIFQGLAGLAAIIDDGFFSRSSEYAFDVDTSTWGWIHLLLGILLVLAGLALFAGRAWAGVVAIVLAVLSAIGNFFFIPYYPFWAILEIALACWVIWAITRPGVLRE